jgi:hypothetical protein
MYPIRLFEDESAGYSGLPVDAYGAEFAILTLKGAESTWNRFVSDFSIPAPLYFSNDIQENKTAQIIRPSTIKKSQGISCSSFPPAAEAAYSGLAVTLKFY